MSCLLYISRAFSVLTVLALTLPAYSQDPSPADLVCNECAKSIIDDPLSPYNKYKQLAESKQQTVYAHLADLALVKLAKRYCNFCLGDDGRQQINDQIEGFQKAINDLKSDGPVFGGGSDPQVNLDQEVESYRYLGPTSVPGGNGSGQGGGGAQTTKKSGSGAGGAGNGGGASTNQVKKVPLPNNTVMVYDPNTTIVYKSKPSALAAENVALYKRSTATRDIEAETRRHAYNQYVDALYNSSPRKRDCPLRGELNRVVAVSPLFMAETNPNSLNASMPWSGPTVLPGTSITFQYSLMKFCKGAPIRVGPNGWEVVDNWVMDNIAAIISDYGFVKISNQEKVIVKGKIGFEYTTQDGKSVKSFERFVLAPGQSAEEMGMSYLACKFKNVWLEELECVGN